MKSPHKEQYLNGYKIEPTDVTTSDKVLWTFQATHYTMASKVKNRWGGWFAAWKKDPNIRDVYVYLHNTRDAVAHFALLYPCIQRASLTSRKGHRCVRGHPFLVDPCLASASCMNHCKTVHGSWTKQALRTLALQTLQVETSIGSMTDESTSWPKLFCKTIS